MAPFILRGLPLLGVASVVAPRERRLDAWARLARELDRAKLAATASAVPLAEVPRVAEEILAGRVRCRVVVEVGCRRARRACGLRPPPPRPTGAGHRRA